MFRLINLVVAVLAGLAATFTTEMTVSAMTKDSINDLTHFHNGKSARIPKKFVVRAKVDYPPDFGLDPLFIKPNIGFCLLDPDNVAESKPGHLERQSNGSYDHVFHISEIPKSKKIVVYSRESTKSQKSNGNLDEQADSVVTYLEDNGYTVLKVFKEVANGSAQKIGNRDVLKECSEFSKEHNAAVVAESLSRFVRSDAYHPVSNCQQQAEEMDIKTLLNFVEDAQLATIEKMDADFAEERSNQILRGQKQKDSKGGRPKRKLNEYKKPIREQEIPKLIRLRKSGFTLREIAGIFSLALTTVARWMKFAKKKDKIVGI